MNFMNFEVFSAMHDTGLQFGKTIVLYGAGFSIGKNVIRVIRGKERGAVAVANVIRDVMIFFGFGYIGGALGSGAVRAAFGKNVDVNLNSVAPSVTDSAVGESATALSGAAGDLIERVTEGVVGQIAQTGGNVGGQLTAATSDTAIGGAVATIVNTLGAASSLIGGGASSIVPAVTFGFAIGILFAFIFDN